MGFFPFYMDIGGQKGVIAGGGKVAFRKVQKLLPFGPSLWVVAPNIEEPLRKLAAERNENCRLVRRRIRREDLQGAGFVIAATDDKAVNEQIFLWCQEHRIPVNVVDDPALCTFYFPALVQEGPVTVGISTGGKSPTAAAFLCRQAEKIMPEGIGETVELLGQLRPVVLEHIDKERRNGVWEQLFAYCMQKKGKVTYGELKAFLDEY